MAVFTIPSIRSIASIWSVAIVSGGLISPCFRANLDDPTQKRNKIEITA